MSAQPETWHPGTSEEEPLVHLELVVDNNKFRLPRPPAGYSNDPPMANWELFTWSTIPERDHEYNGVISYADPWPDGSPRRFVSEAAYQAYKARNVSSIAKLAK